MISEFRFEKKAEKAVENLTKYILCDTLDESLDLDLGLQGLDKEYMEFLCNLIDSQNMISGFWNPWSGQTGFPPASPILIFTLKINLTIRPVDRMQLYGRKKELRFRRY
jgi:hypothetical protein